MPDTKTIPASRTSDEQRPSAPGVAGPDGRWLLRLGIALALLPLVVSAVDVVVDLWSGYYPAGDLAGIELKVRDVPRHPVLTGLFSRDGWDHPGPAFFYLLALPYRLVGGNAVGLHLGALAVNGTAIIGMALVARRRGGTPLFLLTLVGSGLLVRTLGADFVRDPWNPWLPVLAFGLLVFLSWEMTCGGTWALPVSVGVASFCIQTHIGYAPLAGPLVLWGLVWLVWVRRKDGDGMRELRRPTLAAAAVLVVLWLPSAVDQLVGDPGNLTVIKDYFLDDDGEHHSLGEGFRLVGGQFGWPPEWLSLDHEVTAFTGEPTVLDTAPAPLLLIPFALAVLVLWRRQPNDRRFAATVCLTLVLGVLWVARTLGPVFAYRIAWAWVVAMVAFLVMAWALWALVSRAGPLMERRLLLPVAVAGLAALAAANSWTAVRENRPSFADPWSSHLAATAPGIFRALPDRDGVVVVTCAGDVGCIYSTGLFLALERRGAEPRVEVADGLVGSHARHRVHEGEPVRAVLRVEVNERFDEFVGERGWRLLAYRGPRAAPERAQLARRIAALDAAHEAGEVDDIAYFRARVELSTRLGPALGVFIENEPEGEG